MGQQEASPGLTRATDREEMRRATSKVSPGTLPSFVGLLSSWFHYLLGEFTRFHLLELTWKRRKTVPCFGYWKNGLPFGVMFHFHVSSSECTCIISG